MHRLSVLLFALVAGCAADTSSSHLSPLGEVIATIHFDADFAERVDGELYAGRTIEVSYDVERLPCRATRYGRPAWAITMHYRMNGGAVRSQAILGHEAHPGANVRTIELEAAGQLELWFEASSAYGCHEWDSDYGANYRFTVLADPHAPGWMGNAAGVVSRATCENGGACDADRRPLEDGFTYDTWARQRATIAAAYLDVWKAGVTDFDNPRLWEQLDARVHYRYAGQTEWQWAWIDFERRVGNDARYAVPLRDLDPLGGNTRTSADECPDAALRLDPTGTYVETSVELYFTINGHALRAADGAPFRGTFADYAGLYAPCGVL